MPVPGLVQMSVCVRCISQTVGPVSEIPANIY